MAQAYDEKNKSWYYYGKYPNGHPLAGTQYKKRGFTSQKKAAKAEMLFKDTLKNEDAISGCSFRRAVQELQKEERKRIKESTIVSNDYVYRQMNAVLGNLQLSQITSKIMQRYIDDLDEKYSKSYVEKYYFLFNKIFKFALRNDLIEKNPMLKVQCSARKDEDKKEILFWEPDEFERFIKHVDDKMFYTIFLVLYYMGIRRGEMMALSPADIDLKNRTMSIKHTYAVKTHKVTPPKTKNSVRVITMPEIVCSALESWMRTISHYRGFSHDCYLFGIVSPVSPTDLGRKLDYYIDLCNSMERDKVSRITPHGFRHSHASYLINNMTEDYTIYDIAKRLGDVVDTVLSTYAHWFKAADRRLVDSMNRNMDNKQSAASGAVSSSYGELRELKELLDIGIITTEEFSMKKKQILGL